MNCGIFLRQPPRRSVAAGRFAIVLCLLLLALVISAGPAAAYPCGNPAGPRTLQAHSTGTHDRECARAKTPPPVRKADPISFAFFVGIILAVLLVPAAALGKREDAGPE